MFYKIFLYCETKYLNYESDPKLSHVSPYEMYTFTLIHTNWGFGCLKIVPSPQFYMLICPLNQLRTKS